MHDCLVVVGEVVVEVLRRSLSLHLQLVHAWALEVWEAAQVVLLLLMAGRMMLGRSIEVLVCMTLLLCLDVVQCVTCHTKWSGVHAPSSTLR